MKKLLIIPILTLGLAGCIKGEKTSDYDNSWAMHGNSAMTKVVQIEGHKYIIQCGSFGSAIIHSESCECKK